MALPAFVYLASQSPRRHQLLQQLGIRPETFLPESPQALEALEALEALVPGEPAEAYVRRVTGRKLSAALDRWAATPRPAAPVVCADTTVVLGRRILGKPADSAAALAMLQALSGRTHRVLTAVAVACPATGRQWSALSVSRVCFASIPEPDLQRYVDSGEPMGKAGAYGIQGAAAQWVRRLEGSYTGIMGLPLFETAALLHAAADCSADRLAEDHSTCKTS